MRLLAHIFFFLVLAFPSFGQTVGGAGWCKTSVNPNTITSLRVVNQRNMCSNVWDTLSRKMYYYDYALTVGSRWVEFVPLGTPIGAETKVEAGTGIGVTGNGTIATPYIITNTGDLSNTNEIQRLDTFTIVSGVLRASLLNDGVPFSSVTLPTADGSETQVNAGTAIGVSGTGTVGSPYVVTNTADLSVTAGGTNALQIALNTSGQTPIFVKGVGQVTVTKSATGDTVKIGGVGGIYGVSDTTQPAHVLTIAAASTLTFQSQGDNFGGVVPFRVKSDGTEPDIQGWYANGDSLTLSRSDTEFVLSTPSGLAVASGAVLSLSGDSVTISTVGAALSSEKTYLQITPGNVVKYTEGIPLSHLNQSGATTGQVVKWNGAAWVPDDPTGGGSSDSTWVKTDGTFGSDTLDNVRRSGTVTIGSSSPADTLATLNLREKMLPEDNLTGAASIQGVTNGDSVNIFLRLKSSAVDSTEDFVIGCINSGTISAAGDNTSWYLGQNIMPGGSRIDTTKSAMVMFFEDNFINPLPLIGNVPSSEMHWGFVSKNRSDNAQSRVISSALDHLGRTSDFGIQTDKFYIGRFGNSFDYRMDKPAAWAIADFYAKTWDFYDTLNMRFLKNNHYLLQQRDPTNSFYVGAIKVDDSNRVLLGGQNETNIAAYNQLEVTNSGEIFNADLGQIKIGKTGLENNLVLDGYVQSGRSGEAGRFITYNHDASTSYANSGEEDNIRLFNSNTTSNNWSGISSFSSAGIDAAVGFRHLNHAAATGQISLFARSAADGFAQVVDFSPTLSQFYYPVQLRATTFQAGYSTTFNSPATFNNGFTVNTVAPTFNTSLQLGGSAGSKLTVYNDYNFTSAANSSDYEGIFLGNRNTTNNNWTAISFNGNGVGGGIAADIAAQYTSHSNLYADIVFHTRSTSGYNEVLRVTGGSTSPNRVGILTNAPSQPLHVSGNARVTGAIYDSSNDPGSSGQVLGSTGTGTDWVTVDTNPSDDITGSGAANQFAYFDGTQTIASGSGFTKSGNNMVIGPSGGDHVEIIPGTSEISLFNVGTIDARIFANDNGKIETNVGLAVVGNSAITGNLDVSGSITTSSHFRAPGISSGPSGLDPTPSGTLQAWSPNGTSPYVTFSESGAANRGAFGFPASSGDFVWSVGNQVLSSGTERMRLTSGGNLGIGLTPSERLHVSGNIRADGTLKTRGTGTIPTLYLDNTTATTGKEWYVNSGNAGGLFIGNPTTADAITINGTTGATTIANTLTVSIATGTAATITGRTSAGVITDVPLSGLTLTGGTLTATGGTNYQTFKNDGVSITQRANADFISTATVAATLTDNGSDATEAAFNVPTDGITATQIAANAVGASELSSLGTAGTYGSATQVPVFITDADGRVSSVTNTTITGTLSGLTATRVPFASAANALADDANLTWNNTTKRLSVGNTGGSPSASLHIAEGSVASWEPLKAVGTVSGNMITTLSNAQNSGGASNNIVDLSVGGLNGGDPMYRWLISGVDTWSMGIDNSDADKWKLKKATTPSTLSNVGITMTADATPLIGINNDAPLHPLHVIGRATATVFQSIAGTPTHTFANGAGTSPTLGSFTGTTNGIDLTFTTGTTPTPNGNIISITYPTAFSNTSNPVFCASNAQAATDIAKFYISAASGTAFTLTANGTLSASTTYRLRFNISGR